MQTFAALAVLAEAGAQVGGLLGQDIDFLLLVRDPRIQGGDPVAEVGKILVGLANPSVQVDGPLPQLAQLALARQDAGLGVMGADGQCAVRFEQFALEGDQPVAAGVGGDGPGRRQVADDEGSPQKLGRQVGQFRAVAGDQLIGGGHHTGVSGCPFR